MSKILLVDDDRTCNEFMTLFLQDEGYEVRAAHSAREALALSEEYQPDLLVADWLLKDGIDGAEMAHQLLARYPALKIVFTTGSPAEQLRDQIKQLPVAKIFEKPIDIDELLEALTGMLESVN